jgi:hypothetical protein
MKGQCMSIIIAFLLFASCASILLMTEVSADSITMEMVDASGYVGECTSIALDSNDNPRISYYDRTTTSLKYTEWTGNHWDIITLDSYSNVGKFSSMALDPENDPHIVYYDSVFQNLKYAGRHRDLWSIKTLDSGGDVGKYSSIAVSEKGHLHISYYNGTTGDLKYVLWDGITWKIETIDSEGDVGRFTSIALDSEGKPCISYIDHTNSQLKYAKWTGSEWFIQRIAIVNLQSETSLDFGSGTSLAVDSNDQPHIVFIGGRDDNLRYARWDGMCWTLTDVSDIREVYLYVSLALDSRDRPHISYYTNYDNKIHYARWTDSEWDVVYVLPKIYFGTGGKFNSIAIDSEDYAHISFFDTTYRYLRYARFFDSRDSLQKVEFKDDAFDFIIISPPVSPPIIITPVNDSYLTIRDYPIIVYNDPNDYNLTYNVVPISNNDTNNIDPFLSRYPYYEYNLNIGSPAPSVDPDYPYYKDSETESESESDLENIQGTEVGNSRYVVIFASFMILILTVLLVSLMSIYKGSLPNKKE